MYKESDVKKIINLFKFKMILGQNPWTWFWTHFGFYLNLELVLYLNLVCPIIFFASYSSLAFLMLCKRFAFKEQTSQQEKLEMIHFNLHLCPVYQVKCPINFVNVAVAGARCVKMRNFVAFFKIHLDQKILTHEKIM